LVTSAIRQHAEGRIRVHPHPPQPSLLLPVHGETLAACVVLYRPCPAVGRPASLLPLRGTLRYPESICSSGQDFLLSSARTNETKTPLQAAVPAPTLRWPDHRDGKYLETGPVPVPPRCTKLQPNCSFCASLMGCPISHSCRACRISTSPVSVPFSP